MSNNLIEIETPKPYDYIGARFTISGWVHLSWFESDAGGLDWRMFVDYLSLDIKTFMGTSPSPKLDDQNMKGDKVHFLIECELHSTNIHFIQSSHGRITIKIASPNKAVTPIYLPLIVRQFEDEHTADQEVVRRHAEAGETELRYENELKTYYEEMKRVYESRKAKDGEQEYHHLCGDGVMVGYEIYKLLEEDTEQFDEYTYSAEDRREEELNEQYKEALDWRGPLAGGVVSRFDGFELRVYSDDHDKHFHVIHKGKGVDARFSFPDMQLMSYKNARTTIGSKAEKKIREYCLQSDVFKRFEEEFKKRN